MEAISRTKAVGGSIMVRIPKDMADEEGISPNQLVKIKVEKVKLDGFGIFKGRKMPEFTEEDRLDSRV